MNIGHGDANGKINSGARVLLVDDYPDALEIWQLYLTMSGYVVASASNGLEAVEMARSFDPDVAVMDLELPQMTGIEAARCLRAETRTSGIRLIAATGYSHQQQLDAARRAGFEVILIKPCDPTDLVTAIEKLLATPRRLGEQPATPSR